MSEYNPLLGSPQRARRVKGRSSGGQYSINAESRRRINRSIFEQFPIVSEGCITQGISYKIARDGAAILSQDYPDVDKFPYLDVITCQSWQREVTMAIMKASIFFVGVYSHAAFFSANFLLLKESQVTMDMYWNWAAMGIIFIDYIGKFAFAWHEASIKWKVDLSMGIFVTKDDLPNSDGSELSRLNQWKAFLFLVMLYLLAVPMKVQVAPAYFSTDKALRLGASVRVSGGRFMFVGYRSKWEYKVENHPSTLYRMMFSLVTGSIVIAIKAVICMWFARDWFFTIVNVGIPICLQVVMILDAIRLYLDRSGYRRMLEDESESTDPNTRMLSKAQLKQRFGIKKPQNEDEKQAFSMEPQETSILRTAEGIDKRLAELKEDLEFLKEERRGALKSQGEDPTQVNATVELDDSFQMLDNIRAQVQRAMLPCFYEVASLTGTHTDELGFPHDFGPLLLQPMEALPFEFQEPFTTQERDSRPTPWTMPLDAYPESSVAQACAVNGVLGGVLSPLSRVSLGAEEKTAAGIPEDAAYYAWNYTADACCAGGEAIISLGGDGAKNPGNLDVDPEDLTAADWFLACGGYVYFDLTFQVIHILSATVTRFSGDFAKGTLGFRPPLPITPGGPLEKALQNARRTGDGYPTPYRGLDMRMLWLSSEQIRTEARSPGGFLFFYT